MLTKESIIEEKNLVPKTDVSVKTSDEMGLEGDTVDSKLFEIRMKARV